ncbi:uncharacterized protein LOC132755694 [Ruditapes philippinarum]|uniref:uncharacterized protein LOC132755694 n=1 Tax=Ruditapes philippinarum TaxID=129788 RepID=UPI00295C2526|nr:uncharacterized protein LOC132755694 [Ruditapes philippinarum]
MEVPGKLDPGAVSAEDSTLVCLPCENDGLKEPAYGFCQDCQEHLCETCFKHHRRPRPMRNHVLIDKESMPKTQVNAPIASGMSGDKADFCKKHQDKPLEFYCRDHTSVDCYVCVTLEHKQCKVDYIPDVSGILSDEMTDILEQMEALITKCKSNIFYVSKAAQDLDQSHAKVVEDIKVFRKEINECLDKMETRILKEADTIVKEAKCSQETVKAASLEITEELECSHSLLRSLQEQNKQNKLFIEIKNVGKSLPILTDKEKNALHANTTNDCIQFTRNASIIDFLKTENSYGTLATFVQPYPDRAIDLQYIDTIDIKQISEKEKCSITGMVMVTPTKMVVADNKNKNVTLIDIEKNVVVTEVKMSLGPVDVITLPEKKLAVTLNGETFLQILSYSDAKLSLYKLIDVRNKCNGVAYSRGKLIVSSAESKKIIIINLEGEILDVLGSPTIFYGPTRVLISNDESFIYVSDTDWKQKSKVLKMDWKGNVNTVFEEPKYQSPYGQEQLEDETILICCRNSHTILRLSSSLKKCDIIGLEKANIYLPTAVTYCEAEQKLYVSCPSQKEKPRADIVKVFHVKWIQRNMSS